jgi:hypothetical protein
MAYTPKGSARTSTAGRDGTARPAGPERVDPRPTARDGVRLATTRRRRDTPYLVLGLALVVVGALAGMLLVSRSNTRVSVLVLARDVPLGQPVTAADLRVGQVVLDPAVPVVAASDAASVLGRTAAARLRAGRLLAADDVGPAAWPPADQVVVAVAVGPGSFPPELAAGMHVLVGSGASDGTAASGPGNQPDAMLDAPEAVVAGLRDNPAGTGGMVVSLLVARDDVGLVTAIPPSQLRLVVLPASTPAPAPAAVPSVSPLPSVPAAASNTPAPVEPSSPPSTGVSSAPDPSLTDPAGVGSSSPASSDGGA